MRVKLCGHRSRVADLLIAVNVGEAVLATVDSILVPIHCPSCCTVQCSSAVFLTIQCLPRGLEGSQAVLVVANDVKVLPNHNSVQSKIALVQSPSSCVGRNSC